jgi:type III secretory pathway component EscT
VPFPQALIVNDIAKRAVSDKLRLIIGKPFLVGFILGICFQFPLFMVNLFPWFQDIYGWRVNTCGPDSQ